MLIGSMFAASFVMSRARQVDPGRCRACGYALTGSVSGVCPECGSPIAAGGGGDVAEAASA